jgi:DNA-binding Xre family transcriptional regulator
MKIISKLPELMINKRLDQKTLAAKTGLSPITVGKIYRGHFDRIDNHTIKTLCIFFGLKSINQLIDVEWEDTDVEGMGV